MLKSPAGLDLVFQALGDPSRRAIVERLSRGPATLSELARPLPISLPAVHQHLAVLETSGIVRSHKSGRSRTCELDLAKLDGAEHWISQRRAAWSARLDRLGAYLESLPADESGPPHPSPN